MFLWPEAGPWCPILCTSSGYRELASIHILAKKTSYWPSAQTPFAHTHSSCSPRHMRLISCIVRVSPILPTGREGRTQNTRKHLVSSIGFTSAPLMPCFGSRYTQYQHTRPLTGHVRPAAPTLDRMDSSRSLPLRRPW